MPIAEGKKVPTKSNGSTGAFSDFDSFRKWHRHEPNDNIAIAAGQMSDGRFLFIIDLDVDEQKDEDGLLTLRRWESENGELPETWTAVTPRGGYHIYYWTDHEVKNSQNPKDGVDVRGSGGYVVAPPSELKNGCYMWENDPEDFELAEADANVLAFIESYGNIQQGESTETRIKLDDIPDIIPMGRRNDLLMRYCCSMQSRSLPDNEMWTLLKSRNQTCEKPLGEDELKTILKSVTTHYNKGTSEDVMARDLEKSIGIMKPLEFDRDKNGKKQTVHNCMVALYGDPNLCGHFYYNKMSFSKVVRLPIPWDDGTGERPLIDADYSGLTAYLEHWHGLEQKNKATDALVNYCQANASNPLTEWLDSLSWDGNKRIATLFHDCLGAADSAYNSEVMRVWMLGAVSRAYRPGCKFDYMPVLVGPQGYGKSYFIRMMAHNDTWYCDNLNTVEGDRAIEKLRGMWILEMAELLASKKATTIEGMKAFITSMSDNIRPAYGRETEHRPRTCVFMGTTNEQEFLTDKTGNRRFLPVVCAVEERTITPFDDGFAEYVEQCWAEAVHIYKTEHPELILPKHVELEARVIQEAHSEADPREGMILKYLEERTNKDWLCVAELMECALGLSPSDYQNNRAISRAVGQIMRSSATNWRQVGTRDTRKYGKQKCWIKFEEVKEPKNTTENSVKTNLVAASVVE